jgi:hypothetical protein
VDASPSSPSRARIAGLSVVAGMSAPLVFVSIIVLRKVNRRTKAYARHWGKRFQHEIDRWT